MHNQIEKLPTEQIEDLGKEGLEEMIGEDVQEIQGRGHRLGRCLKVIRDKLFYKPEFSTFEDYCEEAWGIPKKNADRLIAGATVRADIETYVNKLIEAGELPEFGQISLLPVVESHCDALNSVARELRGEVWLKANGELKPNEKLTAKKILDVALKCTTEKAPKSSALPPITAPKPTVKTTIEPNDQPDDFETLDNEPEGDSNQITEPAPPFELTESEPEKNPEATRPEPAPISRPHVLNNSGENEWYTPIQYIEAARKVLGTIDLDPASCELANKMILATEFYTLEDDGLKQPWFGRVWLNPPYSGGAIASFISKYADSIKGGQVEAGIVLVNNATETQWFKELVSISLAAVFTTGRIKFVSPEGEKNSPLQGQAFLYYGDNIDLFLSEFGRFGWECQITEEMGENV